VNGGGLSGFRPCLPGAELESPGYPVLSYENTGGGRAASANLNETAMRVALEYS
jgi:prolyl oligopeptidase